MISHGVMLSNLSSHGGDEWWIGGALLKSANGAKQNFDDYRWTSGQV